MKIIDTDNVSKKLDNRNYSILLKFIYHIKIRIRTGEMDNE